MKRRALSIPEIALIAVTRGLAGAGVGLLLSEQMPRESRRAVGWTLLGIGALTTIPIAAQLFARETPARSAGAAATLGCREELVHA